jgi:photosystem II stability/assembly factor-like uncharacterized protein
MRFRSTILLLLAAAIPITAAFRARPRIVIPPAVHGSAMWTPVASPVSTPIRGDTRFRISAKHRLEQNDAATWTEVRMPTRFNMHDVAFATPRDGIVVGGIGQTLTTRDAGSTWRYVMLPEHTLLNAISALDDHTFIVVGGRGTVLRSADRGANWNRIETGTTQHLRDVAFLDNQRGIVVGMWGTVLITRDGGRTWTRENAGTQEHLTAIIVDSTGIIALSAHSAFRRVTHEF